MPLSQACAHHAYVCPSKLKALRLRPRSGLKPQHKAINGADRPTRPGEDVCVLHSFASTAKALFSFKIF